MNIILAFVLLLDCPLHAVAAQTSSSRMMFAAQPKGLPEPARKPAQSPDPNVKETGRRAQPAGGGREDKGDEEGGAEQGGFVEARMLAREAARDLTTRMARMLCTEPGDRTPPSSISTVIIYNDTDLAALSSYASVRDLLESFLEEFEGETDEVESALRKSDPRRIPAPAEDADNPADDLEAGGDFARNNDLGPAALAAPGIAAELPDSVAGLTNLFHADAGLDRCEACVSTEDVVSFLVSDLNRGSLESDGEAVRCTADRPTVYFPELYPPQLLADNTSGKIFDLIKKTGRRKVEAEENIRRLDERIRRLESLAAEVRGRDKILKETADRLAEKAAADGRLKSGGLGKEAREELQRKSSELAEEVGRLAGHVDALTNSIAKNIIDRPPVLASFMERREGWVVNLKTLKSRTEILAAAAEQVAGKLNKPDGATGLTPLAALLRAEHIAALLESAGTYTLRIRVSAGGTTSVRRNLFLRPQTYHSAGAVLSYQLFDRDGQLVMAGNIQRYFGGQSGESVRKMVTRRTNGSGPKTSDGAAVKIEPPGAP